MKKLLSIVCLGCIATLATAQEAKKEIRPASIEQQPISKEQREAMKAKKEADLTEAFKRAEANANGNPILMNNLGIVASKAGDRKKAMEMYDKANGAGNEVNYNKGILNVRDGKYADAVTNFGEYKGFNKALAELLNGNQGAVTSTIDASNEKDMAMSFYLKAVAAARNNNAAEVNNNLKTAIEKDGSLKAAAKDDAEFIKLRENADFKGLTN